MSMPFPLPPARKGPANVEQIPFGGMTAEQVIRRSRGMEPDPPTIHKVYLRGRENPLIVEGAELWDFHDDYTVFWRSDDIEKDDPIATFRTRDVVAIFEPEPMKPRVI